MRGLDPRIQERRLAKAFIDRSLQTCEPLLWHGISWVCRQPRIAWRLDARIKSAHDAPSFDLLRRLLALEEEGDHAILEVQRHLQYMYCTLEPAMLALRLPPEIEKRLDELARKTGRTKSYYARKAIIEMIEDLDDLELAKARLAENNERIPLEQILDEFADELRG